MKNPISLLLILIFAQTSCKPIKTVSYYLTLLKSKPAKSNEYPVEVPFKFLYKEIVVEASINKKENIPFILDLGAISAISPYAAEKCGFQFSGDLNKGNDSTTGAWIYSKVKLKEIKMGELGFRKVGGTRFEMTRLGAINLIAPGGILGSNIFKDGVLRIDYEHSKIIFAKKGKDLPFVQPVNLVPFKSDFQGTPLFQILINGRDTINEVYFDTGFNGYLSISDSALYAEWENLPSSQKASAWTIPSTTFMGEKKVIDKLEERMMLASSVKIGDLQLKNIKIILQNTGEKVISGNALWEHFLVTIDPKSDTIQLVPRENFPIDCNRPGFGFTPSFNNGNWIVGKVIIGSKAEKEGIEVGDKIILLDGKKLETTHDFVIQYFSETFSTWDQNREQLKVVLEKDNQQIEYLLEKEFIFH